MIAGLAAAAVAVALAWLIHWLVPAIPLLTAAVVLGIVVGQLPPARRLLDGALKPGIGFASRHLMRAGIVLLGLKLSLVDIAKLGWLTIVLVVLIVVFTFWFTWGLGRLARLPGREPLLLAAGFSICGASAIGAMAAATRSSTKDQATPVAMVTLFGTLAIAVLPALRIPLGLDAPEFGQWVGASVHDVGQVVATAQIAGPAALAIAIVVKLTRVLLLAPMVAVASAVSRRSTDEVDTAAKRPPIVPLFVVGFIAAVLVRSFLPVPAEVLAAADLAQTVLLAAALFALGTSVRLASLFGRGARAIGVGLASWVTIAGLALLAVHA